MQHAWKDEILTWDPKLYGGIEKNLTFFALPSADERTMIRKRARLVLSNDGSIDWIPQAIYKSTCLVDLALFPFDRQTCVIEFGSFSMDKRKMELDHYNASRQHLDLSDYVVSSEWAIYKYDDPSINKFMTGKKFYRENLRRDSRTRRLRSEQLPVLQYRLLLERNSGFYGSILVAPCVLMSVLTLVLFWMPPEAPAKLMLGMNIFLALFVLLLLLAESLPKSTNEFPILGRFYLFNLSVVVLSTFFTATVVYFHRHGDRGVSAPPLIRRLILFGLQFINGTLGRLLRVSCCWGDACLHSSHGPFAITSTDKIAQLTAWPPQSDSRSSCPDVPESDLRAVEKGTKVLRSETIHNVRLAHCLSSSQVNLPALEWRKTALVLDRVFAILYVLSIGSYASIVINAILKGGESTESTFQRFDRPIIL